MFIVQTNSQFVNERTLKKLSANLKVERLARFGSPAYIERVHPDSVMFTSFEQGMLDNSEEIQDQLEECDGSGLGLAISSEGIRYQIHYVRDDNMRSGYRCTRWRRIPHPCDRPGHHKSSWDLW
jgi:hypothetical protein